MPGQGGVLYSADMTVFYQTFFKNPNGDWRYILGYEPAFMPDADFQVFHRCSGISAIPRRTNRG